MPTILTIGSLNTDLTTLTPRLPNPGETLPSTSFTTSPGGKGANQAVACARLSSPTTNQTKTRMIGAVGTDSFGPFLTSALEANNIDTSGVKTVEGSSGVAVIIVEEATGENRILFNPGANAAVRAEDWETEGVDPDLVVVQLECPVETVVGVLKKARQKGVRTVLNPAPAVPLPESVWRDVDYLILNETEAEVLSGVKLVSGDDGTVVRAAVTFLERGVREAVVITLGARGCYWTTRQEEGWEGVCVRKEEVRDTTGAGDTFVGAFCVGVVEGVGVSRAVKWAGKCAGEKVRRRGAMEGIPWRKEVGEI